MSKAKLSGNIRIFGNIRFGMSYASQFDGTLCLPSGYILSGSTFNCLTSDPDVNSIMAIPGTGLGVWYLADHEYGYVLGDTFNSYFDEDPLSQSLDSGSGIGTWGISGNELPRTVLGETFNAYLSQDPITQSIVGNTGTRTGNWYHGDGP